MTDAADDLEAEYCPPLDPAVFQAIVSDHDLTTVDGLNGAKTILDHLKFETLANQANVDASGWDPSGTGGVHADSADGGSSPQPDDMSSITNGVQDLLSNASGRTGKGTAASTISATPSVESLGMEVENALPEDEQVHKLLEIFPDLKDYTVRHKLRACGGNWSRAVDELLNLTFIDGQHSNDQVTTKGIDAFSEDQMLRKTAKKTHKGKKKKQRSAYTSIDSTADSSEAPFTSKPASTANAWLRSDDDVGLIAAKLQIPLASAKSLYHRNQMSVQQTVVAILDSQATEERTASKADDAHVQVGAVSLREEFPTLSLKHAVALVAITHPLFADARELATLISAVAASHVGGVELIPKYAPLALDNENTPLSKPWQTANKKARSPVVASAEDNAAMAAAWSEKASQRFQQASVAHRKGKSNHLMGAAAGYYAQEGHDAARRAREYSGYEADTIVAERSDATYIDLHYISVKDAVRIARSKTEDWWRRRKGVRGIDGRIGEIHSTDDYLTIVTGRGAHSTRGVSKIGPAVSTMLIREGWNISHNEGHIHVNGKGRK